MRKLISLALCVVVAGSAHAAPRRAEMADRLADMVGVNTHINYLGTVYDTRFDSVVRPRLLALGVRHIRDNPDGSGGSLVNSRYIDLARNGIRTLMINWPAAGQGHDYVKALNARAGIKVVEAVEPPNERDGNWADHNWGSEWPTRMREWMQANFSRYKNDPATAGLTVLGPSLTNGRDSPAIFANAFPNAEDYLQAGNLHNYSGHYPEGAFGGGYGMTVAEAIRRYRAIAGSKPIWVTENGYKLSGGLDYHPAVTPRAAAKYMPRQLLTHFANGVRRYYIYELMNESSEDFALINNDGSLRPQFKAVRNLISMFNDPGSSFQTDSLDYQLTGDLADIKTSLFQKRDGRFYLVVWQAVASARGATDGELRDVEPPLRELTLTTRPQFRQAKVTRVSFRTQPEATYAAPSGITSIPLLVPDHALVVELIP